MQLIFQRYSSVIRDIKSCIQKKKNLKIVFDKNALTFSELKTSCKEEREKSAKDFFLFIRRYASHLDIETLSMGERLALLETTSVLSLFIHSYLCNTSTVRAMLEDEIFCLKLGCLVPRNYIEKNTEDLQFIRINSLDQMLFYHGIRLSFHPKKGIGIPMIGTKGIKHDFFFSELKRYTAITTNKYYHNGEFLFSTDEKGKFLQQPKIQNQALVINNDFMPFIIYKSGYPSAAFEICYRKKDVFVVIHDGEGAIYRFGIKHEKIIYPDQYVYDKDVEFKKIFFPTTKENSNFCIDIFLKEDIRTKEAMVEKILYLLDFKNEFNSPLTSANKLISYMYFPKLLIKVIKGEIIWKDLLTPWKLKKIDFIKIENYRGNLSNKNYS